MQAPPGCGDSENAPKPLNLKGNARGYLALYKNEPDDLVVFAESPG